MFWIDAVDVRIDQYFMSSVFSESSLPPIWSDGEGHYELYEVWWRQHLLKWEFKTLNTFFIYSHAYYTSHRLLTLGGQLGEEDQKIIERALSDTHWTVQSAALQIYYYYACVDPKRHTHVIPLLTRLLQRSTGQAYGPAPAYVHLEHIHTHAEDSTACKLSYKQITWVCDCVFVCMRVRMRVCK